LPGIVRTGASGWSSASCFLVLQPGERPVEPRPTPLVSAVLPEFLRVHSPFSGSWITGGSGPGRYGGRKRGSRRMARVTPTAPETTPRALRGPRGQVLALTAAFVLTLPGVLARIADAGLGNVVAPVVFGLAILGSAFLLAWASEALQLAADVALDRPHAIEITFLALATLYSLTLPLKETLTIVDSIVLIGIFVMFVFRLWRAPSEEPHLVGPARLIGALPTTQRRVVVGALLAYAAGVIFLCAEPFAESLVHLGERAGISTFLLVQWVAPLASEAPELLVAALFAWRLNTSAGLGTLLSSKVNQWTLLVGSLPIVFALSAGHLSGLPLDALQREE